MEKITPEDSAIIARFQVGSKEAFDELVQKHHGRVYNCALQLIKYREEANDIVNDAFIRVFRSLADFRGESSFTTWLHWIVVNCFFDLRKKRHYRCEVSLEDLLRPGEDAASPPMSDLGKIPHDQIELRERIALIERALKQLPRNALRILMTVHADSMSYDEIAGSLRLPIGTVESRLNRARLPLRITLQPWLSVRNSGLTTKCPASIGQLESSIFICYLRRSSSIIQQAIDLRSVTSPFLWVL